MLELQMKKGYRREKLKIIPISALYNVTQVRCNEFKIIIVNACKLARIVVLYFICQFPVFQEVVNAVFKVELDLDSNQVFSE